MREATSVIRNIASLVLFGFVLAVCASAIAQAPVVMWKTAPAATELGGRSLKNYFPEQNLPYGRVFHLDANGNSYVAGSTTIAGNPNPNFITIKYDAGGNEIWRNVSDGYFDDRVTALSVDGAGNVYVLGVQGYTLQSLQRLLLIKYALDGIEFWRATSSLSDNTLALALDVVGNAYVSGTRPQGSQITFKFSAVTGEMLWNKEIASGAVNQPKTLAVDAAGNCFVVANTGPSLGNYNYVTVKYNTDGTQQWRSPLSPIAGVSGNQAYALDVDANGIVYVAGMTYVASAPPSATDVTDFLVVKYGANGGELWRRSLNTPVEYWNSARAIARDNVGNIVVSGFRHNIPIGDVDFITAKFDPAGNLLWQVITSEPGYTLEFWPVIATDQNQNIYITGNTENVGAGVSTPTYRGVTFKYSPNGVEQWRMLIENQTSLQINTSHGIALDAARNAYVVGNSSNRDGSQSMMTVTKYSQNGATVPNSPVITSATVGIGSVQIQFTPPVSSGGSPILQYLARCGTTNAVIGPASPLTVPGLLVGVTYSCTVVAMNALGNSAASSPVSVKWIVAPSAPSNVTAIAGDAQAHIGFSAPSSDGGSPIVTYTVSCNPGSISGSGYLTPITISGLANDQSYACSVVGSNAFGDGPASDAVNVTPAAAAPMNLIAAESRKTHGPAGAYGIPLLISPLTTDPITVEPRRAGASHEIVFRFSRLVAAPGSVSALDGNGAAVQAMIAGYSGNDLRVALAGFADNSRVSISLTGINDSFSTSASIGFLAGDINNSYAVNASDISAVKANIGKPLTPANFVFDLDASGAIDSADVSIAKARSGLTIR
ncbi:MAG: hypothetical protein IPP88_12665 [Betaproteobacteria bacterium]|nr:hypothetical protein [Betaproteobacteria bacterium]